MSSLIVTTRKIDNIIAHPNSEHLDILILGGWQSVCRKGMYNIGELVTYIPPDCVIPSELSDKWGVTKYLSNGRVKVSKMRDIPSYGFVVSPLGNEGENIAEKLGITKYIPPVVIDHGEFEESNILFTKYTDIENLRNYTDIFVEGEKVYVTEKIHGTNSRIGMIRNEDGSIIKVSGSKSHQIKYSENGLYWYPWRIPEVSSLVENLFHKFSARSVILYGEIYGKVQSLKYGHKKDYAYRAFDLLIDDKYVDYNVFSDLTENISVVPPLGIFEYNLNTIKQLASGSTLVDNASNIREGVVVRPVKERYDYRIGRMILKYISDEYLSGNYEP